MMDGVEETLRTFLYAPAAFAAAATMDFSPVMAEFLNFVNIAVVALLTIVAYFLKRLLNRMESVFDKVSTIDERLLRLEVQHEMEGYYKQLKERQLNIPRYADKERSDG